MKTAQTESTADRIARLNATQRAWINLPTAAKPEIMREIQRRMDAYPKTVISYNGSTATVMHNGQPLMANGSFAAALALCLKHGGETEIYWNAYAGEFMEITNVPQY